ncbi:MAG: hypothetical protein NUV77_26690, partial [Thermoguttaceae bacterium]|nr:hypothetical protein [Thermoguttaceae bacterium]
KFTAREYDAATGQYYYRARYYDAAIGRFTTEDPLGFDAGDMNLFRYVSNRPTVFADPRGTEAAFAPTDWSVLTLPGIAPQYAEYMQAMVENAAPVMGEADGESDEGWLSSFWNGVTGAASDAWAMVTHPVDTVCGFGAGLVDTFLSGQAWDSFQGALVGVPGAPLYVLTLGYVDLTDYVSPLYGHEDAYNNGWWVGAGVDVAEAAAVGVWHFFGPAGPIAHEIAWYTKELEDTRRLVVEYEALYEAATAAGQFERAQAYASMIRLWELEIASMEEWLSFLASLV